MLPISGPDQSDWFWDGSVSSVGSVLPVSAQPEPDSSDWSYTGSPSCLCTTAAPAQHQADEGTLPPLTLCRYFGSVKLQLAICLQVEDLSALAELSSLQTLNLDGTAVREESLKHLATLPSLSSLSLAGIPIVDGNRALQSISGLELESSNEKWVEGLKLQLFGLLMRVLLSIQVSSWVTSLSLGAIL